MKLKAAEAKLEKSEGGLAAAKDKVAQMGVNQGKLDLARDTEQARLTESLASEVSRLKDCLKGSSADLKAERNTAAKATTLANQLAKLMEKEVTSKKASPSKVDEELQRLHVEALDEQAKQIVEVSGALKNARDEAAQLTAQVAVGVEEKAKATVAWEEEKKELKRDSKSTLKAERNTIKTLEGVIAKLQDQASRRKTRILATREELARLQETVAAGEEKYLVLQGEVRELQREITVWEEKNAAEKKDSKTRKRRWFEASVEWEGKVRDTELQLEKATKSAAKYKARGTELKKRLTLADEAEGRSLVSPASAGSWHRQSRNSATSPQGRMFQNSPIKMASLESASAFVEKQVTDIQKMRNTLCDTNFTDGEPGFCTFLGGEQYGYRSKHTIVQKFTQTNRTPGIQIQGTSL